LRAGSHARQHIQHFHLPADFETKWLTIIYTIETNYKTLHILAPTTVIFRLWHVTLLQLKKVRLDFMMGLSSAERAESIWERHHWKGADTSGDGKLDLSEAKQLCRRLNLSGGDHEVKRRFADADAGKKGFLTYEQFRTFVRRLKGRPEVEKVYLEVKGHGEFDFACFQRFMKETQKVYIPIVI
jgi:phosphatidylinositol phospholipase C delta